MNSIGIVFDVVIIIFMLIGGLFVGGLLERRREKQSWNNGICAKNGIPWENRDTDSQGGRLYRAGEETTWISYNVDKKATIPIHVIVLLAIFVCSMIFILWEWWNL